MTQADRTETVVLLVGHGTVFDLADLPAFLRRIRRGRPAPPELVEDLRLRYSAIGGSPLLAITEAQASLLEGALGMPVRVAMRLWAPTIPEVLEQLVPLNPQRLVVLPVAPFSVHVYEAAVRDAMPASPLAQATVVAVEPYGTHPELVRAWAERIRAHQLPESHLVLSAHSLPLRVLQAGDPYQKQVEAAARAIAAELGAPHAHQLCYQSQGASGGEWLGPDLERTLKRLRAEGVERVTLAPIGFLADHVETLFDLDIEARRWADELGLELARVPALNTDAGLIRCLADVARQALA